LETYAVGSWGPIQADQLLSQGAHWSDCR